MYGGADNFIMDKSEPKHLVWELMRILLLQLASFRVVINLHIVTEYNYEHKKMNSVTKYALYCTRS